MLSDNGRAEKILRDMFRNNSSLALVWDVAGSQSERVEIRLIKIPQGYKSQGVLSQQLGHGAALDEVLQFVRKRHRQAHLGSTGAPVYIDEVVKIWQIINKLGCLLP